MSILELNCARYTMAKESREKKTYPYYRAIESEQSTVVKYKGKDVLMFELKDAVKLLKGGKVNEFYAIIRKMTERLKEQYRKYNE